MAKKNTEVLNTNETEILEEKKDGEGVDTIVNHETGVNSQNPNSVEENAAVKNSNTGEQVNADEPTDEAVPDPTDTEQSDADKKNSEERGGKSQKNSLGENGKRFIRHTGLKNGKVIVFDGSFVEFDEEGIAEVDDKYAEFLLQIPGYESVVKEAK